LAVADGVVQPDHRHTRRRRAVGGERLRVRLGPDGGALDVDRRQTGLGPVRTGHPVEKMAQSIHAGDSSQICDGSAASLLMSADKAQSLGLKRQRREAA